MFSNIGTTELIILGLILLLLFGGKKLPELSRGIGDAVKEFRKGFEDQGNKK
ncbi:MAG: Sec-independent protein translocase protein TatA [Candidatus Shapirobacteria bacterium GW2011_GWE1_38_92]|uniref:Sec-independent protein translocase protein TatA n=1 Tax=Candidatus Shapirobacteria bacterium GW2011_GWE1_38_92 TaxID=1618489 RepID=A0A0G0PKF6_9BACT|nr:MAG: Sec-independent protein translocase protein TatA [Candidatus Shapirobacteria bacterium GW2011_GWE1_38_92]HAP37721.1 twin-arginine translocase TatA/TatE family subunit [Candidatus Shapirobacteria bacterium]HCU55579.1 twin-arginine translocase TatA/TatE family subunit [Candidatus Shapirobacteria bacterium]